MLKKLLKVLKPMITSFTDPAHFATFRCAPFPYSEYTVNFNNYIPYECDSILSFLLGELLHMLLLVKEQLVFTNELLWILFIYVQEAIHSWKFTTNPNFVSRILKFQELSLLF